MSTTAHLNYKNDITDHIKNVNNYVPTGTFVTTLTYTFVNNRNYDYRFSQPIYYSDNKTRKGNLYGCTNMKLIGELNKIKVIELTIGGNCIDRIYPSINDDHHTISLLHNKIIPFTLYHEIRLNLELLKEAELTITFEAYKLKNPILNEKDVREILCPINQYCGIEYQKSKINTLKLNFNMPIHNITIFSLYPLTDLKLILDDRYTFTFKYDAEDSLTMFNMLAGIPIELCEIINLYVSSQHTKYVCKPVPSVNFSRVNSPVIYSTCNRATTNTPNSIHVFGRSENILRLNNYMSALLY